MRNLFSALLFLLTATLHAQSIESKADRIVNAAMREKQIPGLVLGIVKDGKVVVAKGYGVASTRTKTRPDVNTVFSIGSLSKALTAFGVMRLVDEGKVSLEQPASQYVKGLPKAWQGITVRQFMTHTSGIPPMNQKKPTFEAMLRAADREKMAFAPGTDQDYNNFNFAVMGKLIENVSGKSYLAYMEERVFTPLGMTHTGQSGSVRSKDRAEGHALKKGKLVAVEPEPKGGDYGIPSGFLETTLADLLKFEAALRTHALMKPQTYKLMLTPYIVPGKDAQKSFTPGWQSHTRGNVTVIAKDGAVTGFESQFHFVPSLGDAVILIWNMKGNDAGLAKETNDLVDLCLGEGTSSR
jgi:CubicO group peptidase (beta-lactamase class C family)